MGTALSSLLVTFVMLTTILLVYQAKTSGQTLVHEATRQAAYRIQNSTATKLDMIPVKNSVFKHGTSSPATSTNKILYKTWTPNGGLAQHQIRIMDEDGGNKIQLTSNTTHQLGRPDLSQDGTKIVYDGKSHSGGKSHVFVMDADGTNQTQITFGAQRVHPRWNNDATKIVYYKVVSRARGFYDICTMDANGTNEFCIIRPSSDHNPSYSPDGTKILYNHWDWPGEKFAVAIMDADGTNIQILTDESVANQSGGFSADGTKIVYHCANVDFHQYNQDICTMNSDGTNQTRITNSTLYSDKNAVWTADGKIVFASNRIPVITPNPWAPHSGPGGSILNIFTMNADGTNQTQLTSELPNGNHWHPTTHPKIPISKPSGTFDCGMDFWIKNIGESTISGYEYMNVSLVFDEPIDPILLKYSISSIADLKVNEWTATIPDTDLNEFDELHNNNSYQVDVLNNGEYMRVTLKIPKANKSTGTVIFSPPNGKFVTSRFYTSEISGEIVLRCGGII